MPDEVFETVVRFPLSGDASVAITFRGHAVVPTSRQFAQIVTYLDVWAGGDVVQRFQQEVEIMSTRLDQFNAALQRMADNVTAQTTVTASVLTFIDGLKAEIAGLRADLAAAITDATALETATSALDDFDASLDAQRDALAAAVIANTPVADEPVDPPVDPAPAE